MGKLSALHFLNNVYACQDWFGNQCLAQKITDISTDVTEDNFYPRDHTLARYVSVCHISDFYRNAKRMNDRSDF